MLQFADGVQIELAVAVSLVSLDGARRNLAAEVPTIDFDAIAEAAQAAWHSQLGVVRLRGGTASERRIFYTSLYHAFLMPSVIDDADGTYQLAGRAPALANGWRQLSDLSLWDTYRTVHPLYAWLAPTSARDAARSIVAFGDQTGVFPHWPLATGETRTMLGSLVEIVLADAAARGVPLADLAIDRAWPQLRAAALDLAPPLNGRGTRGASEDYFTLGYVPSEVRRSVSHTTEYAHADFALAQLAEALGHSADRDALRDRSRGWRALFDARVGFLRARGADGAFAPLEQFDLFELADDYAEANAWPSLWMAGLHDPDGLAELFGGRAGAIAKLEELFEGAERDWTTSDPSAANFPRPYYWHGNESALNAAYLFAQWGRRDLAQRWTQWIADELYNDRADGVAGNDDGGTLGSWYVLSSLGVYPIAGSDRWILVALRFTEAVVVVAGRELTVRATGDRSAPNRTVLLDGRAIDGATITHAELAAARDLEFVFEDR